MTTTKLPEPDRPAHGRISSARTTGFECLSSCSRTTLCTPVVVFDRIPAIPNIGWRQRRAILATYLESGMELESILELFGRAAVAPSDVEATGSDGSNQRRSR